MNRVVFAVNTVMTLMSSVYYAIEIKRDNPETEITLIWQNTTPHRISLKRFNMYFDKRYEIPKDIPICTVLSIASIKNNRICKKYLRTSGIYQYLHKKYDVDILMVSADYRGLNRSMIDIYYKKRSFRKIILMEEGMALYSDEKNSWKEIIAYNLWKADNVHPVIGGSYKVDTIFARHPTQIPKWKSKNKQLIKQSDVFANAELWKNILNKNAYLRKLSEQLYKKKLLLYLGQPIHQFSEKFDPKQEIDLIYKILDKMPKDYVMLIKAHPRDPVSKYQNVQDMVNCIVFDRRVGWYPVECLLSIFDTRMVMSFSSSAALNILDRVSTCRAVYTYRYFDISVSDNWRQMYKTYGDRVQTPVLEREWDNLFQMQSLESIENTENIADDLEYIKRYLKK